MSPNRILYTEARVRTLVRAIRANDAGRSFELDRLRNEVLELRQAIAEMLAARRAVENAEAEVRALYREREIARCAAVERDGQPLH
jgi:hypothetical protein